jgi:hypothetical protein
MMTEWVRHAFTRETFGHPAAIRLDVDGSTMYVGMATCGTVDSDPHWQIKRVVSAMDGDVSVTWAEGNDFFDNVWDDRAALSYQ